MVTQVQYFVCDKVHRLRDEPRHASDYPTAGMTSVLSDDYRGSCCCGVCVDCCATRTAVTMLRTSQSPCGFHSIKTQYCHIISRMSWYHRRRSCRWLHMPHYRSDGALRCCRSHAELVPRVIRPQSFPSLPSFEFGEGVVPERTGSRSTSHWPS